MSVRVWQRMVFGAVLALIVAGIAIGIAVVPALEWQGGPRFQVIYEIIGACIAAEVAVFAVSRFGLERRRLPLCIGLAFLAAVIADCIAALQANGVYLIPLVGQTDAITNVWVAGRLAVAMFLLVGLVVERKAPATPSARAEMAPLLVIGAAVAFALAHGATMVSLPFTPRVWNIIVGAILVVALVGYWRVGGSMVASVLVSLVVAVFAQVFMARSAVPYDGFFNLALVLKVASYVPPLVGLFAESVILYRAQRRLTGELQVAQAELREYSKDLERKVAERTVALETRAKDLEAFAYTVSHDLKAPLRGVHTYGQMLAGEYADKLDATGRRYVESLNRAANNMRLTIDDLLAYSRLERREAEIARVDLRDLTQGLIDERQHTGAVFAVDIELPAVVGDRAMLREAIANLLDNAIKYSAPSPRITVRGREENGQSVLSVSDNGIGFDMQYKEKIFELFQRLHRSDEIEGTGIGLSIVKRAVEKHRGRVWAESEPGKGATFHIALPKPSLRFESDEKRARKPEGLGRQ